MIIDTNSPVKDEDVRRGLTLLSCMQVVDEKEEELIDLMQRKRWNIDLRYLMPKDYRVEIIYPKEFYRALTYLLLKSVMKRKSEF